MASFMQFFILGEAMNRRLILALITLISSASLASQVQLMTSEFSSSQSELRSAFNIKSIEKLLLHLDQADQKLKSAQKISSDFKGESASEQRLQIRLATKIARDLHFINRLKEDLGLAEQDSFEVYKKLRLSFLKDVREVSAVKRMDQQILLTVERFFHESQLNRI